MAYTGSKGVKLGEGGDNYDLNQMNPQYLSLGRTLQDQVPEYLRFPGNLWGHGSTLANAAAVSSLPRDYGDGAALGQFHLPRLADDVAAALRCGLALLASYTNGKLIDDLAAGVSSGFAGLNQNVHGAQSVYNLRVERSISPSDISQRLVVSFIADSPFGKGKHWLPKGPRRGSWAVGS